MGRYRDTFKEAERKAEGPHPIWRGIGCMIIIIVPILSFTGASLTMPVLLSRGLVPEQLLFTPLAPDWLWYVPILAQAFQVVFGHFAILATLIVTFVYILILGGIFSFVYALMYRSVAPSRFGPMDAPPPKVKVRKYRR